MQEKIREIIGAFTNTPVEDVHPDMLIDRSALKSSIMLHRFYARLGTEGVVVEDYSAIRTVRDLLVFTPDGGGSRSQEGMVLQAADIDTRADTDTGTGIGIDIEEIANMPVVPDFREDEFYRMNFTAQEIAYCILRPNPYASFAGLFAVKEAIVKSDEKYRNRSFNKIAIGHSQDGRPTHAGFHLSISHAREMAVAVAAPKASSPASDIRTASSPVTPGSLPGKRISYLMWVAWLSLLLSVLAVILVLVR